ncbi:hypothetical protein R1sor_009518 [Riccia sorocarpa]|uniref:F-box domain-containing protein n=1 Tax=Riccia sorocarpa TaxID=122646 RepID=A0ABD3HYX4_9MARC
METEDFDSTLWQQLPFELLENILTKLPVSTLLSFCQVCKQWKMLIQSTEFARRCGSIQPLAFFLHGGTATTASYLAVPNTKTNTWEKHTLNFGPDMVSVAAADQGLICFQTESKFFLDALFIYNPLRRQWRKLRIPEEDDDQFSPRFTLGTRKLVGLVVDQATGNYTLIVGFIKDENEEDEKPTRTLIYDSVSFTWTTISVCPVLPEDENVGSWDIWVPWECVRCGDKLYWLVDEDKELTGTAFRFIVKFDVKAGIWTVDEPHLPYPHFVGYAEDGPGIYVRPLSDLPEPYGQGESKSPPWNFHLASHGGTVYVILFDSFVSREAFSGYLPTKAVCVGEVWYVLFEYGGVSREGSGEKPLLVFGYNARRSVWGWLPELGFNSSCVGVVPEDYPPHSLPEFYTCTLSLRAFL